MRYVRDLTEARIFGAYHLVSEYGITMTYDGFWMVGDKAGYSEKDPRFPKGMHYRVTDGAPENNCLIGRL